MEVAEDVEQMINLEAIKQLSTEKKRMIIDMIEETIEKDDPDDIEAYAYELPEELEIIEARLLEHLENPEQGISWEDLKAKLLSRHNG